MRENTQLGASIEELTDTLGDDDGDAKEAGPTTDGGPPERPEDNVSRWPTPSEVGRWSDVDAVTNAEGVHMFRAFVDPSDAEAVKERLSSNGCRVRSFIEPHPVSGTVIEFEEAHCPF